MNVILRQCGPHSHIKNSCYTLKVFVVHSQANRVSLYRLGAVLKLGTHGDLLSYAIISIACMITGWAYLGEKHLVKANIHRCLENDRLNTRIHVVDPAKCVAIFKLWFYICEWVW